MDNIDDFLDRGTSGQDTKPSDINVSIPSSNDGTQFLTEGANLWNYEQHGNDSAKNNK